ncbi:hypothetical protein H7Y63_00035, partial [Polaromonas sp.]|nr:hypothetical protein [Candidatus Saccharibacteria bacterium]
MEPSAAEQLSCKDGIFLAPVIRAYEDDGCIVGPETRLAVSSIKRGIKSLRASDDPYIQGQIGRINKTYFLEDGLWQDADAFTKWKPGRNLLGNLLRANTAQVVEFAELYDGRVRQLQRGLIDDHDELADDALRRTHRLVGSNVLPKSAELLMEQTIDWAG